MRALSCSLHVIRKAVKLVLHTSKSRVKGESFLSSQQSLFLRWALTTVLKNVLSQLSCNGRKVSNMFVFDAGP